MISPSKSGCASLTPLAPKSNNLEVLKRMGGNTKPGGTALQKHPHQWPLPHVMFCFRPSCIWQCHGEQNCLTANPIPSHSHCSPSTAPSSRSPWAGRDTLCSLPSSALLWACLLLTKQVSLTQRRWLLFTCL